MTDIWKSAVHGLVRVAGTSHRQDKDTSHNKSEAEKFPASEAEEMG